MSETHSTPLRANHQKLGARMMVFGGSRMPLFYTSIITEHLAVRNKAGLFDVSHMGEIELRGEEALLFADYMLTNEVRNMKDGDVKYSPMCYPDGGQVDDLFIYRMREDYLLLVVNASPGYSVKDFEWLCRHRGDFKVEVNNVSPEHGIIAFQGPESERMLEPLLRLEGDLPLGDLKRFQFRSGALFGKKILISRTGYTGEDGFELYSRTEDISTLWEGILADGAARGVQPCGLGARDTLRFEVGYWLYGNDCDEAINPLESGQGWAVKFYKSDFIGKEALEKVKEKGIGRKLVGLYIPRGGIPRPKMEVRKGGEKIGYVTSGNYCPSLKRIYAMALLRLPVPEEGSRVTVVIRNKEVEAEVVALPFLEPINKRNAH